MTSTVLYIRAFLRNVLKLIARVQSRVAIGSTRVAIGYAREVIVYDQVEIE